jgi:transposase-like protein
VSAIASAYLEGAQIKALAQKYKVTRSTLIRALKRAGVEVEREEEKRAKEAARCIDREGKLLRARAVRICNKAGMTWKEIGRAFGVSRQRAHVWSRFGEGQKASRTTTDPVT